ncbi:MAG TPA: SMC-Scp complex subunit ScpB [Candidatus Acidoferrales bacterium]|nr:SMC-Scp complex subunit ScpB [Candidatus Acidoferrales bacterium]
MEEMVEQDDRPKAELSDDTPAPPTGDETTRLARIVESVLFASAVPMGVRRLVEVLEGPSNKQVQAALNLLQKEYSPGARGIQLHEVAGGYQFRTARENAEWVRAVFRERPTRLGRAALETLAVIAYKQPVTKAEIEIIRGVDVDGTLNTLLGRRLIKITGRKEAVGRPLLYATSPEFLEAFGLKDLQDLPSLKELGAALESEDVEAKLQAQALTAGTEIADAAALECETSEDRQRIAQSGEANEASESQVVLDSESSAEISDAAASEAGSEVGVETAPAESFGATAADSATDLGTAAEDSQPRRSRFASQSGGADSRRSGSGERAGGHRVGDEGEPADGSDHD